MMRARNINLSTLRLQNNLPRMQPEYFCLILAFLYVAAALMIASPLFFKLIGSYILQSLRFSTAILTFYFGTIALMIQPKAPIQYLWSILKQRGPTGYGYIILFATMMAAFTSIKTAMPEYVDFYADFGLANLDRLIHGKDTWIYAHSLINSPFFDLLMINIYERGWFLQWFATFYLVAFSTNKDIRTHYMISYFLTLIICGSILAITFSSVGPIFFDRHFNSNRFAELDAIIRNSSVLRETLLVAADYLYTTYQNNTLSFGAGISAMPSVHIAMVTLNAWFLSSLNKWAGVAGFVWAGIIFFGSIWTGYHYAVDGYVSFAVVTLIWFTTRKWFPNLSQMPVKISRSHKRQMPCRYEA